MPLLGNCEYNDPVAKLSKPCSPDHDSQKPPIPHLQSQHSGIAKTAIMSHFSLHSSEQEQSHEPVDSRHRHLEASDAKLSTAPNGAIRRPRAEERALSDTPATTAPNTPVMYGHHSNHMVYVDR